MTRVHGSRLLPGLVLAAAWAAAAYALWRSDVPTRLPHLGERAFFSDTLLGRSGRFERFLTYDVLGGWLAGLLALAWYARNGRGFARESAAGRIGTGMLLGMLGLGIAWFSQLPFGLAALWWERRYHVSKLGYLSWAITDWLGLGGRFLYVCFALLIVMALARPLGERWWLVGGPVFVALALLLAFVQPWLIPNTHGLRDARLARDARLLERTEGVAPTPVVVQDVHSLTDAPNAEATGMGPSRRVVLWDTLLDSRFGDREVRVVLAHEFGHLARHHIWKLVGWYALLALPTAWILARTTRRAGGMASPAAVPLALLVVAVVGICSIPLRNLVSRHIEAEADWSALQATRDPAAAGALFREFTTSGLDDPSPGLLSYVFFANHPTTMQRLAMVAAWRARAGSRYATSDAQSP